MIKVVAKIFVDEENMEEYHSTAKELICRSREEEGNVLYSLNQSLTDPRAHCFIEIWKDEAAIEAHGRSEHFTRIIPKLDALAAERLPIDMYREIGE